MIVVDVNVVAYLLIEGEHTRTAERVLERDPAWYAPLLWRSEWRNVLAGYLRRDELDLPQALERVAVAQMLFRGREHLVDDRSVMSLVASSMCSAYDCEYVALAEALDVPLVTNDRQLLGDFPDRACSPEEFLRTG